MKIPRYTALLAVGGILALPALSSSIKGRLSDSQGEPLAGAVITLRGLAGGHTDARSIMADADGSFAFAGIDSGRYELEATFIGMDTLRRQINLPDTSSVADLGDMQIYEHGTTLAETVVTGVKSAIVARQDTMEFNAGSFRTAPNATVEDLLKKLPGVEVGSDGSITSGGKSVTKILVDGKEFFNDDPRTASRNLPSDMVEKVQVVDRKSDLARLTGVDDGEEETVINLTVKKDRKNGWFGNVGAGYGTDGRYQGSFVVNRFQNGNQITLLGGINNINDMGFSDGGAGRFMSFGGGGGELTSSRIGLNFNIGKEEKIRFGGNIMYAYTDRDSRQRTSTQYLFPDSVSYYNSGTKTRDKGHNLRADFRLQWNIDECNTLDFRPRFSFNSRRSLSNDSSRLSAGDPMMSQVNSSLARRTNSGNSWQTDGELIYNHKFASRPGRSFSAQVRYSFSNTRQYTSSLSELVYYLMHDQDEDLYRFLDSKQWSNTIGGRLTWLEPLGDPARGNFLSIAYNISYKTNNSDKYTYNLEPDMFNALPEYPTSIPDGINADPNLSNRFRNTFLSQELRIGYKKTAKKYNLEAGMVFAPSQSSSKDLINSARDIPTRRVWNIAPYARFRYRFDKTTSISANYRARTSEASLSALQPVADVSDPLHITVGNPSLRPTFTQSVGMHFNSYNASRQQSIFAVLNASYSLNNVVNRTVTDPETGVRTTTYSNVNGHFQIFGMGMLSRPLDRTHWRMNARMHVRYSNAAGYINGDFNRSGNLVLGPTVGVTYSNDVFQMTVNPTYSYSLATNTLSQQPDRSTHTYGFTADANLALPFGLTLSTDIDFSSASGYQSGFNTTQWLWNAELSYSLLRDRSLTLSVRASDILGQQKSVSRSVSANMISDSETNNLGRYIMFGITWKFNTLGKSGKSTVNPQEMPDDGDHPRPPRGERPMGPPPGGHGNAPMGPPPGRF